MDHRLSGALAQIHDNQISFYVPAPSPSNDVLTTLIVRPAGALAQAPLTISKNRTVNGRKQSSIKLLQVRIDRFCRSPAQEDRQLHFAALELSLVKESRARQGRCRYCNGALLGWRKGRSRTRFIVVLDEAQEFVLICRIGAKMQADAFRILMLQPVIQPFVIAEVEAFLFQLPLQVPVGFGDEAEVRSQLLDSGNHVNPILGNWFWPRSPAPRAFEHRVQEQH